MTKIFITKIQPLMEDGLKRPAAKKLFKEAVGKFIDKNVDRLTTAGPDVRIIFSDEDRKAAYDLAGVEPDTVSKLVKESGVIKPGWVIMNEPFNTTMALVIRYYTKVNDREMVELANLYFGYSMYPSLHSKYFKFNPTKAIMDYTINNMSNKFLVKNSGTIGNAITQTVTGSYTHHKNRLIQGNDKDIVDFVMDVKTRTNSLLKNIAREYYKNHEDKKYLNADQDNYDPDNYHETDSNMYAIERITNKVSMRLVTNGPNVQMVSMAADLCKVSKSELRNYMNTLINSDERDNIHEMIESIMYLYLFDAKNKTDEVAHNMKFLNYCLEMYKKSNTTDKNIIKIKKMLDKWLNDVGAYKKTQRVATLNDFRRAMFLFFVISIMNYA